MTRKVLLVFLIALLLLTAVVLTACETAGSPQPTVTPRPATPRPATTPVPPTQGEGYPTLAPYPTP